jgi:hypothetical protein
MTRVYSIIFKFLELLGWLEINVSNEIQPNPNLLFIHILHQATKVAATQAKPA